MGTSRTEAGSIGGKITAQINKNSAIKRIEKYNLNPKLCNNCQKVLEYSKRSQKYCSRSCASSKNNSLRSSRKTILFCVRCNSEIKSRSAKKYCSDRCNKLNMAEEAIKNGQATHSILRTYLIKTTSGCFNCGITDWMGVPITLQLHHIDGDSNNNALDNVQLLCPNCHSITPNFGRKNLGNGRAYRRERYAAGKSR